MAPTQPTGMDACLGADRPDLAVDPPMPSAPHATQPRRSEIGDEIVELRFTSRSVFCSDAVCLVAGKSNNHQMAASITTTSLALVTFNNTRKFQETNWSNEPSMKNILKPIFLNPILRPELLPQSKAQNAFNFDHPCRLPHIRLPVKQAR